MLEDVFDDFLVVDKSNDAHRPVALGAGEGVYLIDLLYQPCPVLAVSLG